jgi:hypothetical protein
LSTGVLSLRSGCEQLDEIPSFRYHLGPRCRGGDEKRILQLFLTISQRGLIGLNLVKIPANFGIFLRGHSAVLVKIDRRIRHRPCSFLFRSRPSSRPQAAAGLRGARRCRLPLSATARLAASLSAASFARRRTRRRVVLAASARPSASSGRMTLVCAFFAILNGPWTRASG